MSATTATLAHFPQPKITQLVFGLSVFAAGEVANALGTVGGGAAVIIGIGLVVVEVMR